jgi:hypothetical protein
MVDGIQLLITNGTRLAKFTPGRAVTKRLKKVTCPLKRSKKIEKDAEET